jgi:hypothetical protein
VRIEFTKSARKHKIGKQRVREVIATSTPTVFFEGGVSKLRWVGTDRRGLELEILALEEGEVWLVIHVMPLNFRRRRVEQEMEGRREFYYRLWN